MRVLSQLLGTYSNHNKPLIIFRSPDTDTLFYRLSDIQPLFNLPQLTFKEVDYKNCYRDHEDTYLNTDVLLELGRHFNRHVLAELCKLKPMDYNVGLVDSFLQTFPQFKRAPKEEHNWESVQLPLENLQDVFEREQQMRIKQEPSSPPPINQAISESRSRMALDEMLSNSKDLRRQNLFDSEHPTSKRQKVGGSSPSTQDLDREKNSTSLSVGSNTQPPLKPLSKVQSFSPLNDAEHKQKQPLQTYYQPPESPQQASEKKRLSIKHKNALNLTIFAPSYTEPLAGIKSAPINSNFKKSKSSQQLQQYKLNHQINSNQAHSSLTQNMTLAPASATIARPPFAHQASPRRHEFAIPPIVPSQQQPPHSAHPTSRENLVYQSYLSSPSVYDSAKVMHPNFKRAHDSQPRIAVTAAGVPLPPKTPTTHSFAALQRQQYLQPFEHLFDTIETARTLKTTLDDQIRRSSSLMQTLQASATTIEGLVRNQVKEIQSELTKQVERTLDDLMRRIDILEHRYESPHQASPPLRETQPEPQPEETLQTPPTIVRSQNDIGPQEYHTMLNTLKDRLDRLERQIEI